MLIRHSPMPRPALATRNDCVPIAKHSEGGALGEPEPPAEQTGGSEQHSAVMGERQPQVRISPSERWTTSKRAKGATLVPVGAHLREGPEESVPRPRSMFERHQGRTTYSPPTTKPCRRRRTVSSTDAGIPIWSSTGGKPFSMVAQSIPESYAPTLSPDRFDLRSVRPPSQPRVEPRTPRRRSRATEDSHPRIDVGKNNVENTNAAAVSVGKKS